VLSNNLFFNVSVSTEGGLNAEEEAEKFLKAYNATYGVGIDPESFGWQPIETAPKDGTEVLLFGRADWLGNGSDEDAPQIIIGVFDDYLEEWSSKTNNPYSDDIYPTHWMPLPSAPTAN